MAPSKQIAVHGARSPQARLDLSPPAGEGSTLSNIDVLATWLRRQALGVNLQRRHGVGLELLLLVSPRIALLHLIIHAYLVGSGPSVCLRGPPSQCLIGHFRLRRSLNIVLARAQARSSVPGRSSE